MSEIHLTLERLASDGDATIGLLKIDGQPECFTLEDERRDVKIAGETRIPAGVYPIKSRDAGGLVQRYKKRFSWQRGMLWLQMVPGFQWIYIHIGNDDGDTAGCILVGAGADLDGMTIGASAKAYARLYEKLIDAAETGQLTIEIIDRD